MALNLDKNEENRLAALARYSLIDMQSNVVVEGMTSLAAQVFRTPIALLNFVDRDCIRIVSSVGIKEKQIKRTPGLCDAAIRGSQVYHLPDSRDLPGARNNPLISGPAGCRFYAAAPLCTPDRFNIGTLCLVDRHPRDFSDEEKSCLKKLASIVMHQLEFGLMATRLATLEHEHKLLHRELEQTNKALLDSEERFRDLFDEAPIAYVHEDLESRFIRANRTAVRTLGLKPEEAVGTMGKTLVAETPDTQRQLKAAFNSIGLGADTSGVILEMRRKDNGKPVWIQWWSRPAPDGSYTRTMFIDITERVLMQREKTRLEAQNNYLQEEICHTHFGEIIGSTANMQQVFADIEQLAPTTATVLILGETGTGKELIARAIHKTSQRSQRPLVKVNCSALPAALIESELFGHEKGAFTGATAKRTGRFALADGGTIFLDEIGDLPIELQAKLLRVLQEGEFEPLGSSHTRQVDVRVIAATNRDLAAAIKTGEFREDLYFRLAVFPIELPPLKDRLEDLPGLTSLFANKFAEKLGRNKIKLSTTVVEQLASYSWPGNVRELQNVVERALITSTDGGLNLARALPESVSSRGNGANAEAVEEIRTIDQLQQLERDNFLLALDAAGWQVAGKGGAAEMLKMNPTTLSSRMKTLKIKRPEFG